MSLLPQQGFHSYGIVDAMDRQYTRCEGDVGYYREAVLSPPLSLGWGLP